MSLEVINLGAGVQSTTMALMAAHGELTPMPDVAIFADTGAEPRAVYEHLEWLQSGVLPFPINVVQFGNIRADIEATAKGEAAAGRKAGYMPVPFRVLNADGSDGMLHRECTSEYKIRPIEKEVKRLLGFEPDRIMRKPKDAEPLATQWIGISTDEWIRAKSSGRWWTQHRHPLLEFNMSRGHCLEWLYDNDYPIPPRSACTFCPYRGPDEWRALKENPEDWAEAVHVDRLIRDLPSTGVAGLREGGRLYLDRSMQPIDQVDFRNAEDLGQGVLAFGDECEGMCGV